MKVKIKALQEEFRAIKRRGITDVWDILQLELISAESKAIRKNKCSVETDTK